MLVMGNWDLDFVSEKAGPVGVVVWARQPYCDSSQQAAWLDFLPCDPCLAGASKIGRGHLWRNLALIRKWAPVVGFLGYVPRL